MSKSIIEAFVIPGSNGKPGTTMFGILDKDKPYFEDGKANGLSFGAKKAALLLYILDTDPDMLKSELRAYLNIETPSVDVPVVAPLPVVVKPTMPPDVVKAPAVHNPGPSIPRPSQTTDTPIKTSRYGKHTYGQMSDGSTRVHKRAANGQMIWAKSPMTITWDAPATPSVKLPEPVPTVKTTDPMILREIVDGDTLVVLYLDGTYKLHDMSIVG